MNKSVIIAIVVIVVLAVGTPSAIKLMRKPAPSDPAVPAAPAAAPAPDAAPAATPAPAEAAPAAALEPPADAKVFVGTTWTIKGASVTFKENNVASVKHPALPMPVDGTWSIAGNVLTIGVMGKSYTAQVSGDKLMLDGKPIERVP